MKPEQDAVMAYVDGELDAPARARFEAALAADPTLQDAVQRERQLRQVLSAAYDPVLNEPMPAALRAAVAAKPLPASAQLHDLAAARAARQPPVSSAPQRTWAWPEWGALAACLVVGLALGLVLNLKPALDGGADRLALARAADGTLRAQGSLDRQLTQALASEPATEPGSQPAANVAVGLSFLAQDGRYCRSFALAGAAPTAGLACRTADGWVVQALMPAQPAASAASTVSSAGFRMAATALPPALLDLVDTLRAADTLDAAAERAARDRGWRR